MWHVLQSEPSFFAPSPTISVCKPATLLVSSLDEVHSFTASACRKINSPPLKCPRKRQRKCRPWFSCSRLPVFKHQGLKVSSFKTSRLQGFKAQALKSSSYKTSSFKH
jgi:hypothetical protein